MIVSPLTKKANIRKIFEVDSDQVIDNYKRQINIDVKRFFDKELVVSLYECLDTGYKFYFPFSLIGDKEFYEDLSKNRKNYYSDRWEHKKTLEYVNKEDSLLEIGSGFGSFLNLLKMNDVINTKGLELNSYAVSKCASNGLNVQQRLIQEEANINKGKYDVVCSFQVLEHITDVYDFIEASLETINENGKLIIGVPNNNPYLFVNDRLHTLNLPPHHAGLWNKKALKSLETIFKVKLEHLKFEPLEESYNYFINFQLKNNKNLLIRKSLIFFNRFFPKALKKILCRFINGRNVLAIYKKIS
ncbi:class I SAM-dependent methyltransferase [Flavobacterium sp. LAR06]|uniref:class I SAM-dependent methyltransferase n=1 Tax=Flavobacterium sp. LAR06 TaxID=3064897 RepID=UPI0035BF72BE